MAAVKWKGVVLLVLCCCASASNIKLNQGVYSNIVVGVQSDTDPPEDINTFKNQIKEFLKTGSEALNYATTGKASFGGDVTVVVPRTWSSSQFAGVGSSESLSIRSSDILLHGEADALPDTLQVEQCGVPGRQIRVPLNFLSMTEEDEQHYGTAGMILTHEWAHLRYGAQDEHGFSGDPVYASLYGQNKNVTSCSAQPLKGQWKSSCVEGSGWGCTPGNAECYFCIYKTSTPADTQASLAYLPALSTGKFCDGTNHNREAPSPQNILCGKISVTELIASHPDTDNMVEHDVGDLNIILEEEALPRILILLDTPCTGSEDSLLDYSILLAEIQSSLTLYKNQQNAMLSYRALSDDQIELYNKVDFAADNYDSLASKLPAAENCSSIPDLSLVLTEVLATLPLDDYTPGTLIVMPVTNDLMEASKLDQTVGDELHKRHIKPLLLFAESDPSLAPAGPFIQHSGARFIYSNGTNSNGTDAHSNYAAYLANSELEYFISNTFMNDHPIVFRESGIKIDQGGKYEKTLLYQPNVAQHLVAVVKSETPEATLKLLFNKNSVQKDCLEYGLCTYVDDMIFFRQTISTFLSPGEYWTLTVENVKGPTATVSVTWSEVNFIGISEELDVQIWSSEGRGPIAPIAKNSQFVLYASVLNYGYQILSTRIHVYADVLIEDEDGETLLKCEHLELLDDGTGMDTRRDDSVYSVGFAEDCAAELEAGSVVTVTAVFINSYDSIEGGESLSAKQQRLSGAEKPLEEQKQLASHVTKTRSRSLAKGSSGLYTMDPMETECCGSFVDDPNLDFTHRISGFNVYLWNVFDSFKISRKIEIPPTTTTTATITTTNAASTTLDEASTTIDAASTTTNAASTTLDEASTTIEAASTTTNAKTTTPSVITTSEKSTTPDGASTLSIVSLWLLGAVVLLQLTIS